MASDDENKEAVKEQALRRMQLQKEGKIPPDPRQFLIAFPIFLALNYYLFKYEFWDSVGRSATLLVIVMLFTYLLYRYRKYKYSRRREN